MALRDSSSLAASSVTSKKSSSRRRPQQFVALIKYEYDIDKIEFPVQFLYKDFLCCFPSQNLDFSKWTIPKHVFDLMAKEFMSTSKLCLNYAIGFNLSRMQSIKYLCALDVLHLRGAIVVDVEVAKIIGSWSRIRELDFSECKIEQNAFYTLLPRMNCLETLFCVNCSGLDDFSMQAISDCISKYRKLSRLYLSINHDFSDEGVLAVLSVGMNLLRDVDISGSSSITSLSIAALRKRMTVLSRLNISNIRHIGQSAFEWVAEGCIFLKELNVSKSAKFDNTALMAIGRSCRHLQHLILPNCHNISDDGVVGFCGEFEGVLESLDLSGCVKCGGPSALALSGISSSLKSLKLNCLSQITSVGMIALWRSISAVEEFEMSADLRSSGTHRRSMIPHISDVVIRESCMNTLRAIRITGASQVTDVGACRIVYSCPHLEEMDISFCNSITDKFLHALGSNALKLKSLNVAGLGFLSDVGIEALCTGCRLLTKLNTNGCSKLTDRSAVSISTLKYMEALNLSSCDNISDEGIRAIASGCKKLKYVDLSNLDLVSKSSIGLLAKNNTGIVKFNCTSCNILPIEFQKCTKHLPYAHPAVSKCRLEPRHRSVIAYNTYVDRVNNRSRLLVLIQKTIRGWVKWKQYRDLLKKREYSALKLQCVYRGAKSRERTTAMKQFKRNQYIQARKLQRTMKRLMAVRLARRKRMALHKRYNATRLLQRCARGYNTRKRLYYRFKKKKVIRTRIFYLAQKLFILREVRAFHMKIVKAQSVARQFVYRIRYQILCTGFTKLHILAKVFLSLRKVINNLSEEMIMKRATEEYAALIISRSWRAIKFNEMVVSFTLECCIHRRNELDMAEWVEVTENESATKIQAMTRGVMCRYKLFLIRRAEEHGASAAVVAQKYIRRFIAQRKFVRWRVYMKRVSSMWRRLYAAVMSFFYSSHASIIQRAFRQHIFLVKREKAAALINRVYRGHRGRNELRAIILDIHNELVSRIQRCWKEYQRRKYEHFVRARKHIAARRIQIAARARIAHVARQRVAAKKKAREIEKELQLKEKLLNSKRMKVIEKIRNTTKVRSAMAIQRVWRHYKSEKDKKRAALEARQGIMSGLVEENERKKAAVLRLPNPVEAAKKATASIRRFIAEVNEVVDAERPKYTLSVLKYQTQSIKQAGIIDIALTFGEGERTAFEQRQFFLKSTRRRYFEMIDGDLSGYLNLDMNLWVMKGAGTECICKILVKNKPPKSSLAAIRNRVANKRIDGINIAWHESVHIELHGICSLKRGESGFAIDGIRICHNMESAQEAKRDGFHICQDMAEFSLPTSIWIHGKEEPPDETVFKLDEIEGEVWFDDRLRKSCQKFNLHPPEIWQMRSTFDSILGGTYDFTVRVSAMWTYFDYPMITICGWLVAAINPRELTELTFSEYVHLISYFCVFGTTEKIRFIFGHMCTKSNQTMNETQFDETVLILTEGFSGQKNTTRWQRSFHKYCNPKLKLMFLSHFEKFIKENLRIMWGLNEIQTKFMKYNIGRNYWDSKNEKYQTVRKGLGLTVS